MSENGNSVLKVVELFVDSINESTKTVIRDLDKIDTSLDDLNKQANTPPRHKELEDGHKGLDEKLDALTEAVDFMKGSVKSMIKTVVIAASLFGAAILIGTLVMAYFNMNPSVPSKDQQAIEQRLDSIEKFIKER